MFNKPEILSEQPLVTIGVASFNNARFVLDTLDSIANQTYKNIELLINDDASTDNSVDLISEWIKVHHEINVRFFISQTNQGICKSGNKILKSAAGKYICIIGSDDRYLPEFIEKRVNFLENTDAEIGLCYSLTYIINTNGVREGIDKRPTPSGEVFISMSKQHSSLCKPFTCLIKKTCYQKIGYYDETLIYEDLDWLLRAAKEYKILYFDSLDSEFRVVPGSLGSKLSTQEGMISQLSIVKKHLGYSKETDKYFRVRLRKLAMIAYKNGLPAMKDILKCSIFYYKGIVEAFFYILTHVPIIWLIKVKHFLKLYR